jgi:hypothetical protein
LDAEVYPATSISRRSLVGCAEWSIPTRPVGTRSTRKAGLITSDAPQELISAGIFTSETAVAAGATLIASEYLIEDVNTFAGLAARRVPVGILSQVTRGRPERSTRYRDLLAPSGIPFELRGAFVAWAVLGAVHIARGRDGCDFTDDDARALAAVTAAIADGSARRFALMARRPTIGAPGWWCSTRQTRPS